MGNLVASVKKACEYLDASEFSSANMVISEEIDSNLEAQCGSVLKDHEIPKSTRSVIHYTSIRVLASMLKRLDVKDKRVSLRAYDTVHFNDPTEGEFLMEFIPKEYKKLTSGKKNRTFVTSFVISNGSDDLSDNLMFWRQYGKEGEGCSLSIPLYNGNEMSMREKLKKVKYGTDSAQDTILKIKQILDVVKPLVDHENFPSSDTKRILSNVVWRNLEQLRYLYKHDAYKHENECRIIVNEQESNQELQFEYQDKNDSFPKIRSYFETDYLDIRKILVTGSVITLGPTIPYVYYMKEDLEKYLKRIKIYGVKVKISDVLYRKN